MMQCPHCGHVNQCERCTQYVCECCGEEMEKMSEATGGATDGASQRRRGIPAVVKLHGVLTEFLHVISHYESMKGKTATTRELAWRQRHLIERAIRILKEEMPRCG